MKREIKEQSVGCAITTRGLRFTSRASRFTFYLSLVFPAFCLSLFGGEIQTNQLPEPAKVVIDFDRDIRPILETSCWRCHGPPKPKSHFRLDNRESALKGGDNNTNDIVPGDSLGIKPDDED